MPRAHPVCAAGLLRGLSELVSKWDPSRPGSLVNSNNQHILMIAIMFTSILQFLEPPPPRLPFNFSPIFLLD